MAQPWAEAFYNSKAWRRCRRTFLNSKHWLCERCGNAAKVAHHRVRLTPRNIGNPYVTLNWQNLEALCQDCHNEEHQRTNKPTRAGFAFDAEGNLVCEQER